MHQRAEGHQREDNAAWQLQEVRLGKLGPAHDGAAQLAPAGFEGRPVQLLADQRHIVDEEIQK